MGGTIIIEKLRLFGHHGVGEQERIVGNTFEYTVRLRCSEITAMESDRLEDTISYAEIINIIKVENSKPAALLEHLAWRIYKSIIEAYPNIDGGRIEVYKPAPPVSAELERAGFAMEW